MTERRTLGSSGPTVSTAGLGVNNFGWRIGPDESTAVVDAALEAGVTFFDTADVYGGPGKRGLSEQYLGDALQGRRDGVVVATKFGMDMDGESGSLVGEPRASRRYIRSAVENSLRRLQTDRIDLLQLHEPDESTPIEETLAALDDLVRAGKVLHIGAGGLRMSAWQFNDMWWTARHHGLPVIVSAQVEWSLLRRERETDVVAASRAHGVGVLPFFPLASGLLSGKYARDLAVPGDSRLTLPGYSALHSERNLDLVDALSTVARDAGVGLLDLALGWLAAHDEVSSVISGARTPDQVRANAAATAYRPSAEVRDRVDLLTGIPA
jgi:aryl-alcohol dehydrogenase-like predicted oxidoreductase